MNKKYYIVLGILILVLLAAWYVNFSQPKEIEVPTLNHSIIVSPTPSVVVQTAEVKTEERSSIDVFSTGPRPANVSNVVGYIAGGNFLVDDLPQWIVDNWHVQEFEDDHWVFTPNVETTSDFSSIVFNEYDSNETKNAEYLYEDAIRNVSPGVTMTNREVILNERQDMRIYYIQLTIDERTQRIMDVYYLDGSLKTVRKSFWSTPDKYISRSAKVREFVRNLAKGIPPQG